MQIFIASAIILKSYKLQIKINLFTFLYYEWQPSIFNLTTILLLAPNIFIVILKHLKTFYDLQKSNFNKFNNYIFYQIYLLIFLFHPLIRKERRVINLAVYKFIIFIRFYFRNFNIINIIGLNILFRRFIWDFKFLFNIFLIL